MLGIDLIGASILPAILIALSAGILSFISPCVLPIVPPYLAYMSGISLEDISDNSATRRRVLWPALFFVMGLSTVFLLLGFTASAFGSFFLQYQDVLSKISGAVVIVFGLHFLGLFNIKFLEREFRFNADKKGNGSVSVLGAYLLGLAFAFGWTPCIGPQLGAILSIAAQEASVSRGTLLLAFYALGLGIPFLLSALFLERSMGIMQKLKRHMTGIKRSMGILLIVVGLALITGSFSSVSFWLLDTFERLGIPIVG